MTRDTASRFESTSAAGAMVRPLRDHVLLGIMLAGLGTSTVSGSVAPRSYSDPQTTSGAAATLVKQFGAAIAELRRLSGLTWDQLARLFNVSRRSLHFWASGKAMTRANEEHLQRLLVVMRGLNRGSARANRATLLGVREDGSIPFDLLVARQYDRVTNLFGAKSSERWDMSRRSVKEVERYVPPPETLVGALQDRIHRESGRGRAAKAVRIRSER